MSKKKVTLEDAKEILGSDKIFFNGNNKFNVVDSGKYQSGITIEIPQEWTIDKYRKPENPIRYITAKELTGGMNLDFNGDASILLGKYRLSKNGKPVFELTDPTQATDVLIQVSWGGAFNRTRGQYQDYAKEVGVPFFSKRSSNGGRAGNDYWILPVNFVKDMESRDVSEILSSIEMREKERISKIDEYLEQENLEIKKSIENKDRILSQIEPIIQEIRTFNSEFEYRADIDIFYYQERHTCFTKKQRYTDELIKELSNILQQEKDKKNAKDTYIPMFKEMENILKSLDITINYNEINIKLNTPASCSSCLSYKVYYYSQDGFNSFIKDLTEYQEKLAREQEEARLQAEKLKKDAELKRKKDEAKEMGYPENFEFDNRIYGAINLGHAYVIESDGTIREPDYNNLKNINHMHKYSDWKNCADGTQGYMQILPGELIITYTKNYTAVPYVLEVAWADGEITEPQLEVICEEFGVRANFAIDKNRNEITDFKQWLIDNVKATANTCKKQLTSKEDVQYAKEILELVKEKATAENINTQASSLTKAYEEQFKNNTNQPSLEDE